MTLVTIFIAMAAALSLAMACAWALVTRGAKSGWIDAIWSFALGAAGIAVAVAPVEGWLADPQRRLTVAALAAVWSLRLGLHIAARTAAGGDDPRYAALKEEWAESWRWRLFVFLQIQAGAALLLAAMIFLAAHNPAPGLRWSDALGILLVAAAIAGESVADAQLARFRRDPANEARVCDTGLRRLSRHPNYFFQWLGWAGYAIIAIGPDGGQAWGWAALAGPVFMYWLLVHVSGIPPLEAHMLRSRGQAFRDYQLRVNAFWPGLRRKGAAP